MAYFRAAQMITCSRTALALALAATAGCSSKPNFKSMQYVATLKTGAQHGTARDVAVKDGYIFASNDLGLRIWRTNSGTDATLIADTNFTDTPGTLVNPTAFGALRLNGNILYVAAYGLSVVDVTDPSAPKLIEKHPESSGAQSIVLGDGILVTGAGSQIQVYDSTDPKHLILKSQTTVTSVNGIGGIAVEKKAIFLWTDGFSIFDASDPTKLVARGTLDNGRNVGPLLANGNGYVYGGYDNAGAIIDVHNLDAPKYATSATTPTWMSEVVPVLLDGDTLLCAGGNFSAYDVSDPVHPQLLYFNIGTDGTQTGLTGLAVDSNHLYTANTTGVTLYSF
jgi:hypothetical protein